MLNVAYAPLTVHRAVVTHFAHHAKRNALVVGLLLLVRTRFQVLFHSPRRGSFRLSLTVLVHYREYLALEDGPPIFRQDTTCPALLFEFTTCVF